MCTSTRADTGFSKGGGVQNYVHAVHITSAKFLTAGVLAIWALFWSIDLNKNHSPSKFKGALHPHLDRHCMHVHTQYIHVGLSKYRKYVNWHWLLIDNFVAAVFCLSGMIAQLYLPWWQLGQGWCQLPPDWGGGGLTLKSYLES